MKKVGIQVHREQSTVHHCQNTLNKRILGCLFSHQFFFCLLNNPCFTDIAYIIYYSFLSHILLLHTLLQTLNNVHEHVVCNKGLLYMKALVVTTLWIQKTSLTYSWSLVRTCKWSATERTEGGLLREIFREAWVIINIYMYLTMLEQFLSVRYRDCFVFYRVEIS